MNLRSKLVACWVVAISLLGATASFAETTPAADTAQAAAAAAAPAEAAAPASTVDSATLARIADLEAYINNTGATKLVGVPGPGHNGWMMTAAALVLFMTLPGLFLFYGGLVRTKNILSVIAQCFGCAGMITILWWAFGYSFTFAHGSPFLGGLTFAFLKGVNSAPNTDYAYWVSQNVFSMYQLMFAIITPALIVGAIAERMKFSAIMLFILGWMLLVYFPLAHMVWGADGFMNGVWNAAAKIKAIDFAGGTVVHMSSGWSALVLCLILGKRAGFGVKNFAPHSLTLTAIGTGMLWVGWYGFNAGSAVAADGVAANAFMTTTLATAVACFVWPMLEWIFRGKPTVLGFCSGAVAGLVVITPATGFVNATGAVIIGVLAGVIPFLAVTQLKAIFKYDDALDTFGVHGVGGTLGALVTGFLATAEVNGNLNLNLKDIVGHTLWIEQLKAIGLTIALAVVMTTILAFVVKVIVGLRPAHDEELQGLDFIDHGESGYHYSED
jgi:ammonium transporter, Amt family